MSSPRRFSLSGQRLISYFAFRHSLYLTRNRRMTSCCSMPDARFVFSSFQSIFRERWSERNVSRRLRHLGSAISGASDLQGGRRQRVDPYGWGWSEDPRLATDETFGMG